MSEKPISPLRRRMLEDMAVRRLGEKTKSNYIRHVEKLHSLPRPLARDGDGRRRAPLPGSFDRDWGGAIIDQPGGHGAAILLWHDRSTGLSSPGILPACTIPASYRGCSHPRRWAVFSKRHPDPV